LIAFAVSSFMNYTFNFSHPSKPELVFMHKALLCSLLIFFLHTANAQYEEKDFVHYTVKEGLSENYITCLIQDSRGYMWIGTDIGLNRFDGHAFKIFFQGTKTLPLLSGTISKLKQFGSHHMGIVSRGGLQLLDTKDLSVKNYTIPDTTAFSIYRNAAWDAVELPGRSYAVTTASGFYVFDSSGKLDFGHDAYHLKDIGQKRILYGRDIFPLNTKENLVYINADGLAYYNAEKKIFREISKQEKEWTALYPAAPKNTFGWISRYQLSLNEFIMVQFGHNNIIYHNKGSNKTVLSPLELSSNQFAWESKITILNDNNFLVNGGYAGFYLFHIDRASGKITANPRKFLAGHKIQCLYLDKDKRLWVGTSKGLLRQKMVAPVLTSSIYRPSVSDSTTGGLVCAYRFGNKLYAGRASLSRGLIIVDVNSKKLLEQIDFYGKNTQWNEVNSIQMYHADTLWIGTTAGLLWFDTKTMLYGKLFNDKKYPADISGLNMVAAAGKDGYGWMCHLLKGVVVRYHIASRTFTVFTSATTAALPFDRVKNITYDAYGDVWLSGHSLARWNTKKQMFDTLISVYSGPNKYEDDILTLVADNNGSLWLHNAFNGLLEYRIKEKRFVSYTMKDGLPSDVFSAFSPVINDHIWMAGHNQLTGFNIHTKKTVVYDHQDGLPNDMPTGRYLYYDSPERMLYLFNGDILSTIPLPQIQVIDNENELMLEEITINNKEHLFFQVDNIKLKPGQNNLSLHFGIINFESGNSYQFAYKLKESDNWTDLGTQRNINLTGLSPGNYNVWLKGTGKSGVQKIKKFSFVIAPPFWRTVWFLSGCCLVFAGLVYMFYRYRLGQVKQKANLDKQLSQTEMKALHAQMNPHFIFNSLNSIREMILNNENKEASHYLSKFAQLIRVTLDQSGQTFISLRNTLDYLQRYIEMEKIRNSRFTYAVHVDEQLDIDETVMPPMLIQPFIENAIWHGVSGNTGEINIKVDFKKQQGSLVCMIDDNGVGIDESLKNRQNNSRGHDHDPVGIANIKNRISLLNEKHNLQSSITITDKKNIPGTPETGTLVILYLPLQINEE